MVTNKDIRNAFKRLPTKEVRREARLLRKARQPFLKFAHETAVAELKRRGKTIAPRRR